MSHSTFVKDDEGHEWVFIHDGAWVSEGTVIIRRLDGEDAVEEHTLPASIIRQVCSQALVGKLAEMLDDWDGSEESADRAIQAMRKSAATR